MKFRRALAFASILAGALVVAMAQPALADDCSTLVRKATDIITDQYILQDCLRTGQNWGWVIGATVGGTGVAIALGGIPTKTETPPTKPDKPGEFEPRDRDECGSELYDQDNRLNRALNQLREAIDAYNQERLAKLDWEVQAADLRVKAAEIRSAVAHIDAEVTVGVIGFGFWQVTSKALILTGAVAGKIAGYGIKAWRGYELAKKVYANWDGIEVKGVKIPHEMIPYGKIPWSDALKVRKMALDLAAFSDASAEGIDMVARNLYRTLTEKRAAVDNLRAQADSLYQQRAATYRHCSSAGNLPPGTWERPAPSYTMDEEGAVIGVV